MSITSAVRQVSFRNREAALGNSGVLYAEVCVLMGCSRPEDSPNPGSVHRIYLRHREEAIAYWRDKNRGL